MDIVHGISITLPKMHIFDDVEVYFNNNIHCNKHNESIFKYKNLPNLCNLPTTENIELSKYDKPFTSITIKQPNLITCKQSYVCNKNTGIKNIKKYLVVFISRLVKMLLQIPRFYSKLTKKI